MEFLKKKNKNITFISLFFLIAFLPQACVTQSGRYKDFYIHLKNQYPSTQIEEEDYFLVILVDACHLDYTDTNCFFQSIACRPSNGSITGEVGHAWIYLQGKKKDGSFFALEGGHSGERFEVPAKYFDGIMNYNLYGYANPTLKQKMFPRYEANPIKYLWTARDDGFFQKGSGDHIPTFAAKFSLTKEQFENILNFIRPSNYNYRQYSLIKEQCCTFVSKAAEIAGIKLETNISMTISPALYFRKAWVRLWADPCYSLITFSTPDVLERSLIQAVERGEGVNALQWYKGKVNELKDCKKIQSN